MAYRTAVFFGDSVCEGAYDGGGGWVDRVKRYWLKAWIDQRTETRLRCFNLGVSGDSSKEIISRLYPEASKRMINREEGIIFLATGLNDSQLVLGKPRVTIGQYKANLLDLVGRSSELANTVILVGPNPVDESKVKPLILHPEWSFTNQRVENYSFVVKEACLETGAEYVDILSLFRMKQWRELLHDGLHPNSAGHVLIARKINTVIRRLLEL